MDILATSDGSGAAATVLPHVARLAAAMAARITLVRVLDPSTDLGDELVLHVDEAIERVRARWLEELADTLTEAAMSGDPAVVIAGKGEQAAEAIVRTAGERGAGLIAMHARGTGALRHALLGSVAMSVLGAAPVPLFLTGTESEPPRRVGQYQLVVTTDGSPASVGVLPAIRPLLEALRPRVTLLRVCELRSGRASPEEQAQSCRRQLEGLRPAFPAGITVDPILQHALPGQRVDEAILEAAREAGADAIALSTHGHSALRHLVAGSVALDLVRHSPIPLVLTRH
jgi:nucleotide-binding universal stress UspA family protein